MRVLVCGGREYDRYEKVCKVLDKLNPTVIIQGGAKGADSLAARYAAERGICCIAIGANWDFFKRRAGPVRNRWMLDHCQPIQMVVAFPGGPGTANMVKQSQNRGLKVKIVKR